jgi:predicted glutamine amidotransferase
MCRLLAYSGEPILLYDLLYRPEHSLVVQSYAACEAGECLNADGFGLGWYVPEISPEPAVFRSIQPAWSSANLGSLSRLTRTGSAFAHIRAASEGLEVSEANCHPFSFGPFLWMHNGTVEGFPRFKEWARHHISERSYSQVRGTTDSELLFALFLDLWDQAERPLRSEGLLDAFRKTLELTVDVLSRLETKKPSTLNLALTDGKTTLVCRSSTDAAKIPPSLHLARNVSIAFDPSRLRLKPARGPGSTLITSEPLFPDPMWEEVPPGRIVLVRPGGEVEQAAI